jgi:hypothetical protein
MKMSCRKHDPAALPAGRNAGIHAIGSGLDRSYILDVLEKKKLYFPLRGFEPRAVQFSSLVAILNTAVRKILTVYRKNHKNT